MLVKPQVVVYGSGRAAEKEPDISQGVRSVMAVTLGGAHSDKCHREKGLVAGLRKESWSWHKRPVKLVTDQIVSVTGMSVV